ncbi:MAG: serine/threonine protein kinase [Polyangiaceae bacterium]|nr:serine/threonine protein kinase [Polyangiaceae bacterium]
MAFVCSECGRSYPAPGFCTEDGGGLYDNAFSPLAGQQLGSYRIARLIGQGGMGEVYLGVQPEIGSRVAIKLLAIDAARSPTVVERFFAEARAVNVIRHEGIVSILDLARSPDGRPYIVMEFLDGAPLAQVFEDHRPMPLGALMQIAIWVLGALGAAHAQGITHRDLKPDNVFVTTLGRVKLLDFGIAKLKPELGGVSEATRTGALLGTPFYMSPEQARGAPLDHRSDLYSLGVILFEGVTGTRPFSASSLYELLRQQIEATPPPVRSLRPDAPAALEAVIARALEKDPSHRYQSAEELVHALQQLLPFLPKDSFATLTGRPSPHAALVPSPLIGATTGGAGYSATLPERRPGLTVTAAPPSRRIGAWVWVLGASLLTALVVGALGLTALFVFGDRDTITIVEAPAPDPADESRAPGTSTPSSAGVLDLKRFDAVAYLPRATELARGTMADSELTNLTVSSPLDSGLVDLSDEGTVVYSFRSPKASTESMGACAVWVSMSESGPQVSAPPMASCLSGAVRPPRCSVRQVLQRARMRAAGATLVYGAGGWSVVDEHGDMPKLVPDGC